VTRVNICAVIFDWGRTLWDSEKGCLFSDATATVRLLSQAYALTLVGLASDGEVGRRYALVRATGLERLFAVVLFAPDRKDRLCDEALARLHCPPQAVAIVDDRAVRGIRWGNRCGATTVWVRRGKFADELPTDDTGMPTHTITSLSELPAVLVWRRPCQRRVRRMVTVSAAPSHSRVCHNRCEWDYIGSETTRWLDRRYHGASYVHRYRPTIPP